MVRTKPDKAKLLEGDPLRRALEIAGYKILKKYPLPVKTLFLSIVLCAEVFNVIFAVEVFRNGSWSFFAQYSPAVFAQQPGCVGLLVACRYDNVFHDFRNKLSDLFSMNSLGREINNRIQAECRRAKKFCILFSFFSVVAHLVGGVPVTSNDALVKFPSMFSNNHFGQWSVIFIGVQYTCALGISYGTIIIVGTALYVVSELKIQIILLKQRLEQISAECISRNQTEYQELIYERIRTCVNNHIGILKAAEVMDVFTQIPILILPFCGICFYVSAFYFVVYKVNPENNLIVIFGGLTGFFMALILCICGQLLTDESEDLRAVLINLPWLDWNKENRRALLIFLMNSAKPLALTGYGLIDINHTFLLSIIRMSYSVLALFKHFEH